MAGAVHRARPWKKLAAKADAGAWVRSRGITEGQVLMEGRLREEMRGRRSSRGRRAATCAGCGMLNSWNRNLTEKKMCYLMRLFTAHKVTRKVKGN